MQPPTAAAYTTIPISCGDVIWRSIQNAWAFVSGRRPCGEFIGAGVFDRPESITDAGRRVRKNAKYFSINYGILISSCGALSLVGTPISLLLLAAVLGMWLVFYFFREDPVMAWGHHVSDRLVLLGLVLASALTIWFTGVVENLLVGLGIGLLLSAVHGAFRNPEGLFLNEDEALSGGLIGSGSRSAPASRLD